MTTAPFLALSIAYKVMKLITMFIVDKPPVKIKNPLFPKFFRNEDEITAAWAGPRPGKNEVNVPEIKIPKIDFRDVLFFISGKVKTCFGILFFEFRLRNNPEIPNKPDNNGNNG